MSVRNILLALGVFSLLASVVLSIVWLRQPGRPTAAQQQPVSPAIMVAAHALPAGTLLGLEDMSWKDVSDREVRSGNLVRGQVSENEFVGAVTRRSFAAGEPFMASDLIKPNEKQFLAAALKPGMRAVPMAVDGPQSVSGLVQPDDRVDIILTQSLADDSGKDRAPQTVAETVLRDVRVIAVDQSLTTTATAPSQLRGMVTGQSQPIPKTVTLEVTEPQAERLAVAVVLGRLQLAIRSLAARGGLAGDPKCNTRGAAASPALEDFGRPQTESAAAKNIRSPPAQIQ